MSNFSYLINGKAASEDQIRTYLKDQGFVLNKTKIINGINARREHIKIYGKLEATSYGPRRLRLMSLTGVGGWEVNSRHYDVGVLLARAKMIAKPIVKRTRPVTKDTLPEPFAFIESTGSYKPTSTYIITDSVIRQVSVMKVVGIEDNGSISENIIYKPEVEAWFLLNIGFTHFTRKIITNGKIWYPVGKSSKKSILRLKRRFDHKPFNYYDQKLINMAIEKYFSKEING